MVIARFSYIKTGAIICLALLVVGLMAPVVYHHNLRDPGFWLGVVGVPLCALAALVLLWEILFHRGRAVWLDDGVLTFVPFDPPTGLKSVMGRVAVDDIREIKIGRLVAGSIIPFRGIYVTRKSRGGEDMPAHLYSEPVEVVFARLNQVLGLGYATERVSDKPPGILDAWTKLLRD